MRFSKRRRSNGNSLVLLYLIFLKKVNRGTKRGILKKEKLAQSMILKWLNAFLDFFVSFFIDKYPEF